MNSEFEEEFQRVRPTGHLFVEEPQNLDDTTVTSVTKTSEDSSHCVNALCPISPMKKRYVAPSLHFNSEVPQITQVGPRVVDKVQEHQNQDITTVPLVNKTPEHASHCDNEYYHNYQTMRKTSRPTFDFNSGVKEVTPGGPTRRPSVSEHEVPVNSTFNSFSKTPQQSSHGEKACSYNSSLKKRFSRPTFNI